MLQPGTPSPDLEEPRQGVLHGEPVPHILGTSQCDRGSGLAQPGSPGPLASQPVTQQEGRRVVCLARAVIRLIGTNLPQNAREEGKNCSSAIFCGILLGEMEPGQGWLCPFSR